MILNGIIFLKVVSTSLDSDLGKDINMGKIIFIIVLIVLFTGTYTFMINSGYQYKEKSITEAAELKNYDITKIVLTGGRNISKSITIADKQKVNEFMKLVDNDIIKEERNHQYSNGWSDYIDFYSNDKKLKAITFTTDLEIDAKYYEIIKGDLNQNKIIDLIYATNSNN
jgi:hypothetical protein